MRITTDIEEATILANSGEEVTFRITDSNRYTLFKLCYYQLKHKTLREFKTIEYAKSKDWLYYMLLLASKLSFGHYKIRYTPKTSLPHQP